MTYTGKLRRFSNRSFPLNASSTPFKLSIAKLEGLPAEAPEGWRRHIRRLYTDLKAITSPSRENIQLKVFFLPSGSLQRISSADDNVVDGILRKAKARLACTCTICGGLGKTRTIGLKFVVLCPSCYTPRRVKNELWQLSRLVSNSIRSTQVAFGEGDLPLLIRSLVPADIWSSMTVPQNSGKCSIPVRYLTAEQVRRFAESLKPLEESVKGILGRRN